MNIEEVVHALVPTPQPADMEDVVAIAFAAARVAQRRADALFVENEGLKATITKAKEIIARLKGGKPAAAAPAPAPKERLDTSALDEDALEDVGD